MIDWMNAAATVAASLIGKEGAEDANDANSAEAGKNRDFQERMSNTAWQRGVKDMQAAGLNPMLAFSKGPASSPGGATAAPMQNTGAAAVNSAEAGSRINPQVDLLKASAEKTRAEADVAKSQALINAVMVPKIEQETKTSMSSAGQIEQLIARLRRENELDIGGSRAVKAKGESLSANHEAERRRQLYEHGEWREHLNELVQRARHHSSGALLQELAEPGARNFSNAQSSWWMRNVSPYLPDVLKSTNSAVGLKMISR